MGRVCFEKADGSIWIRSSHYSERLGYRLVVHPQRGTLRVCLKNWIIIPNSLLRLSIRMMERVAGRSDRMSE